MGRSEHSSDDRAQQIGFEGVVDARSEPNSRSSFLSPDETRTRLWVMGIQAGNWTANSDGGESTDLENLLIRGTRDDLVRFLLLDPDGTAIRELRNYDDKPLTQLPELKESINRLEQLADNYPARLSISYYDIQPCFRMIFRDDRLITSCYSLSTSESGARFLTERGDAAPHLQFREITPKRESWPIYSAFRNYFEHMWEQGRKYGGSKQKKSGRTF